MKEPMSFYDFNTGIRFYLVNCGSGLTHLIIFPDDTVMLFDCNLEDNEHKNHNKDYILELFGKVIPWRENDDGKKEQWIDVFINSHRDTDHLRGLKDVNSHFPIHSIWDSDQSGASIDNPDYKYYMGLKYRIRDKGNLEIPTPSDAVFKSYGEADIYVLCDSNEYVAVDESAFFEYADKKQHTKCMVLLIHYAGRKMLLTGDSDWKAWRDNIVPNFKDAHVNYEDTDILIAAHHGSRTFFTSRSEIDVGKYPDDTYIDSIKLIKPSITLISCGNKYDHPHDDAMNLYLKYGYNEQVYSTKQYGTFYGLIGKNGHYSITPERFYNKGGKRDERIFLSCKTDMGETVESGDTLSVDRKLKFALVGLGDVLDGDPIIQWEVCNAGYDKDHRHHEIYPKGKEENDGKNYFSRDLSYVGTHLLRCAVLNKKKKFAQQIVFVVNGE